MTDPDQHARALAAEAAANNDATGWFERLYAEAEAGTAAVPWDSKVPHPLLVEWADAVELHGHGEPALVIGCGYGDDAEFAAARGFEVTAFDVSPSAIAGVRARFPGSAVHYVAADLFELPEAWRQAYQLVVEIFTVQALPVRLREAAVAAICETVAPGGRLIVIQRWRPDGPVPEGPPWPLTRADIELFTANGLTAEQVEMLPDADGASARWRAEFRRDAAR
ncbi:class I SAM-dependent methyltransferase [Hamadaea sp. NPDC051192]|uniref:class I SAM-dependent methyltransferase n=1 Tax=Hamadaea sp. NPDC051192 TaxID=3154940 RepID=UPI0034485A92